MKTKKLISILITLAMVVSLIPTMSLTAFADDEIKLTTDIIRFNNSHTATSENGHYELSVTDHSQSEWHVRDDCPITIRSKDGQMISNISIKCDKQKNLSSFNFSSGSPSWDGNNLILTGINADEFVWSADYAMVLNFTDIEFYTTHKHDFSDNSDCSCGVPREGTDILCFNDDGTATSKNHLFELNGSVIHDLGWALDVNSPLTIRAKYGQRITRIDVVISHISFGVGGIITTPRYGTIMMNGKKITDPNTEAQMNSIISLTDFSSGASEIRLEVSKALAQVNIIFNNITVYYTTPNDVTEYYCLDVGAGAYIDTEFSPNKDTRVVMDCKVNNQAAGLFGSIQNLGNTHNFYVNAGGDSEYGPSGYGSGYGSTARWAPVEALVKGRQRVELAKNVFKVDGVTKDTHNYGDFNGQALYLFGIHIDDQTQTFPNQHIRFYSCQIYDNGNLVRDFVPAKKNDKFGVFDKKNKKFHEIKGNGTVNAYQAKVTEYFALDVVAGEFIDEGKAESSEGAYINTGVTPTSDTRVVMEAEVEKTKYGATLFGVGYTAEDVNYSFHVNSNATHYGSGFGLRMSWSNAEIQDRPQTIQLDNNLLTIDGEEVTYPDPFPDDPYYPQNIKVSQFTFNHTNNNGGLPLFLFANNFFGNGIMSYNGQHIRFYSCKIYEKGTLVRDFVPATAEIETGVYETGVYDRANGKFYEIRGEGTVNCLERKTVEGKEPTCTDTGWRSYYEVGSRNYKDEACRELIDDLENWKNTPEENGGGMLPKTGHSWINISAAQHMCSNCHATEDHKFDDEECICGRKANYGKYTVRSWDEHDKEVKSSETDVPKGVTEITKDTATLSGGWYIVASNIDLGSRITVTGTDENPTNIILMDDCTLSAESGGIEVAKDSVLHIYGQSKDSGELIAKAVGDYNAGIGGVGNVDCGNVEIFGGTVSATGGLFAAGIGGGESGSGGTVTVYGGTVTANGTRCGAGIGGGMYGSGGTVTVYGGEVTATGGRLGGAGIGGGFKGSGGTVTINGGTVTATGGQSGGAGIGGGESGSGGTVTINGGTVTATGKDGGVGIGAGKNNSNHGSLLHDENVTLALKAGNNAGDAVDFTLQQYINDRKPYVQIFQGVYKWEKPATCTENGHITYYQKNSDYYYDAECTNIITDLEVWLNTPAKDGGGMLPATGHTWEYYDDYKDYCSACDGFEEHKVEDNYICIRCGHEVLHLAKEAAMRAIDTAAGKNPSKAVQLLVTGAEAEIYSEDADTVDKIIKIQNEWIAVIEKLADEDDIAYYGTSLILSSDISVNFYMNLTKTQAENGVMTFTVGDEAFTAAPQYNETEGKYYFRCPLNTLQIATTVKATFTYGGKDYINEYSVKDYVNTVAENKDGKYDTKLVELCKKTANYGCFAQAYLAVVHEDVIIGEGGYAEMPSFSTPDIEAAKQGVDGYDFTDDCKNSNITAVSRSLSLDDKIAMNFYITVKDGYTLTENMITVSNDKEFTLQKTGENEYCISVLDIEAMNFGKGYTVIIDGETINASVLSYAKKVLSGDNGDAVKNVMAALYEYYISVQEYITQMQMSPAS